MAFVRNTAVHACPGGCGANVPNRLYACRQDWYRLPQEFRDAIWATAKAPLLSPERRNALAAAGQWYRDNPRGVAV